MAITLPPYSGFATRRRSSISPPRDQSPSEFASILSKLCRNMDARAAAVVDGEGETVDYCGEKAPFELRLLAAELGLVASELARASLLGGLPNELTLRAKQATFWITSLSHGYCLVVQLPRRAFSCSRRAASAGVNALCREAGLPVPSWYQRECWEFADVHSARDHAHRPSQMLWNEQWLTLDVIGRYRGGDLHPHEHAFRVRVAAGFELTLVRERFGYWYADHMPQTASLAPGPAKPSSKPPKT